MSFDPWASTIDRDVERIKQLLQSGINVNFLDGHKFTPLLVAARHNQLEFARLLFEDYQADLNIRGWRGRTAIWWAAWNGHDRMVTTLAGWGADINIRDEGGDTPISTAAYEGKSTTVKLLVTLGANLDTVNDDGYTIVERAHSKGHTEILTVLEEFRPLQVLAVKKQFDVIKQKIENGEYLDELPLLAKIYTTKILNQLLESSKENLKNIKDIDEFHQKKIDSISLTQHIINRELLKEREDLIDLLKTIKKQRTANKDLEKEVIQSLKTNTKTSPGLATFLTSASSRFSWGNLKVFVMCVITLFSLSVSLSGYSFDVITDLDFANDNANLAKGIAKNDTSSLYKNCAEEYKKLLNESLKITEADDWFLNKEKRETALEKSQDISQKATECFQRNLRFEDQPDNWTITASVTLGHVLLPLDVLLHSLDPGLGQKIQSRNTEH